MESHPLQIQYCKDWHQTYMKHIIPFKLIFRFMTCNKTNTISPQCRIMRFESFMNGSTTETWSKTQFNRTDENCLRQQMIWLLPLTMHITGLIALHLEPGSADYADITMKRKRETIGEEGDSSINSVTPKKYTPDSIYGPRHRDFVHFVALCKELVFDLDVHDFDRFCDCVKTERKILCHHCWLHIEGAYFIMHFILMDLFGYKKENILTVFSGGKGIHCFVNDKRAMTLTQEQRFFMFESIVRVGNGKKGETSEAADIALCEWIERYATTELSNKLESLFMTNVIKHRNLFVTSPAFRQWFLDKLLCHYPSIYFNLIKTEAWLNPATESSIIWELVKTFEIYDYHTKNTMISASLFIIYRLYFPIVDPGPLRMDHSIKLPFSIHVTTKNIALPIDQSFIESTTKYDQIVNLNALQACYIKKVPYPHLFTNGTVLLDKWLNMF